MGLDTVELVMRWEETFQIEISNSTAEKLVTVNEAIDLVVGMVKAEAEPSFCPPRRAVELVIASLHEIGVDPESCLRFSDRILDHRDDCPPEEFLKRFDRAINIEGYETTSGFLAGKPTIRRVAQKLSYEHLRQLKRSGEPWTRSLVRYGVRAQTFEVCGYSDFKDSDRFIEDIRLD